MALTLKPYLNCIHEALDVALCIRYFPSQTIERQSRPEVEVQTNKELLLNPVRIVRNEKEYCLIEPSINSVRISLKLKQEQSDPIDQLICSKFVGFMMKRAEDYEIMRRVPVNGYTISFLITDRHIVKFTKKTLIEFIMTFVERSDKEMNAIKIELNSRGRETAMEFLKRF